MSLRIRVSYENDAELMKLLDLLAPLDLKVKMPRERKGNYLRCYLDSPNLTPYYGTYEKRTKGMKPTNEEYPI